MPEISTKPYLIRALFEWCNDCGYTPYVTVSVGEGVLVPNEYVREGEIVLNVSPLATSRLTIGNDFLEFQARFGGVAREVRVPIAFVRAIYARETGQGMAFEAPLAGISPPPQAPKALPAPAPAPGSTNTGTAPHTLRVLPTPDDGGNQPDPPAGGSPGERPKLTRVK